MRKRNFLILGEAGRLRHAKEDLAERDAPLLRMALENGFPNLESFYRYFQEDTGQTPQEWRMAHQAGPGPAQLAGLEEVVEGLSLPAPAQETQDKR